MSADSESLSLLLLEHHRETEAACTGLLACTYADDPRALVAHYRCFERALLEHLAVEEELILPAYAEHAPAEARSIRDDHAEIRKALNKLGLEVELHLVRASSVDALVASLRAHALREDAAMYPWMQTHLLGAERHKLSMRIGRSLRSLVHFRDRNEARLGAEQVRHTGHPR